MIQTESNENIRLAITLMLLRTGPIGMVNLLAPKLISSEYFTAFIFLYYCHNPTQQQLNLTQLRLDSIITPNPPTPNKLSKSAAWETSNMKHCLAPALRQPDVRLTSDCLRN